MSKIYDRIERTTYSSMDDQIEASFIDYTPCNVWEILVDEFSTEFDAMCYDAIRDLFYE